MFSNIIANQSFLVTVISLVLLIQVLESDNWRDLVDQIWTYVDTIRTDDVDSSALVSKIQRALNRTYRKYAEQCSLLGA